jgi:hypothetical protein
MKARVIQDEPEDDHPAPFADLPQSPEGQPDQSAEVIS